MHTAPPASSDTQRDQDTGRTSSRTPARIGQRKRDRRSATTMSAPQKRVWAVTVTLTLMCFLASLGIQCCAAVPSEPAPPYPFNDPTLPTDQRVADLVSRLTLEEKVAHTHSHTSFIAAAWRVWWRCRWCCTSRDETQFSSCSAWCKCLPPLTKDNETGAVHMTRAVASPGPSFALAPGVGSYKIIECVCIAVWFACTHTLTYINMHHAHMACRLGSFSWMRPCQTVVVVLLEVATCHQQRCLVSVSLDSTGCRKAMCA
jgi:hypothetical protein